MVLPKIHIRQIVVLLGVAIVVGAAATERVAHAQEQAITVHIFWQQGCPYCAGAKSELEAIARDDPLIDLQPIELGVDAASDALYIETLTYFGHEQAAVPLVVIGERSLIGFFDDGRSATRYRQAIDACRSDPCPNIVDTLSTTAADRRDRERPESAPPAKSSPRYLLPDVIHLPLIGAVRTGDLSLPLLTVLLAAIDGFNPCAMWVLIFLIGLLLGLKDERRMWLLGGAFLAATAAMYFAVMAAWLNLILFLGAVVWIRLAIGVLAVGGGLYFLREYWSRPDDACQVTDASRRQRIMSAFRSVVDSNRLLLSVVGIMALAVVVNFIELLCSAGVPAVYTEILVLNDLSVAAYYAYLGLYIAVFLFDDVAIFATAMIALRVTGVTTRYARVSHLIGGVVLLAIGAVMLLRPELLTFS